MTIQPESFYCHWELKKTEKFIHFQIIFFYWCTFHFTSSTLSDRQTIFSLGSAFQTPLNCLFLLLAIIICNGFMQCSSLAEFEVFWQWIVCIPTFLGKFQARIILEWSKVPECLCPSQGHKRRPSSCCCRSLTEQSYFFNTRVSGSPKCQDQTSGSWWAGWLRLSWPKRVILFKT